MDAGDSPGMEGLSRQGAAGGRQQRIGDPVVERRAVEGVSHQGKPSRGQVDPDLVGAAGDQPAREQREPYPGTRGGGQELEAGDGVLAPGAADPPAGRVGGVPFEG
jgi:hypothetical protein